MDIGSKIREARKAKGISQVDAAQKAGIAVNSLRLYEANKRTPKADIILCIASALDISIYDLLDADAKEAHFIAEVNMVAADMKAGYRHSGKEKLLVRLFHTLNDAGQDSAINHVEELTEIPRYQQPAEPQDVDE